VSSASKKARSFFKYRINCLFLQATLHNPVGLLQDLHTDLEESNIESTMRKMKVKPMIAFCPMNKDGCMLAIWTDGYNSWQKRDNLPGQYFLYVPFGVLIFCLEIADMLVASALEATTTPNLCQNLMFCT